MEDDKIRNNIANNISLYRKKCGLTQAQLAERLSYSDKAVSKWERGDGTPDIYVLVRLCKLFGIEIGDLISDKIKETTPYLIRRRIVVTALSCLLNWLVAVVIFVILSTIFKNANLQHQDDLWVVYIYAINTMFIILMVYASMWTKKIGRTITVTGLIWSTCLTIFISMMMFGPPSIQTSAWMFFLIGIPLEAAFVIFFAFKKYHH